MACNRQAHWVLEGLPKKAKKVDRAELGFEPRTSNNQDFSYPKLEFCQLNYPATATKA